MTVQVRSNDSARLRDGAAENDDASLLALGRQLECALQLVDAVDEAPSDERIEAANEAAVCVVESIAALPARTIDGMRLKARAYLWYRGENGLRGIAKELAGTDDNTASDRVLLSLMRDIMTDRAQAAA